MRQFNLQRLIDCPCEDLQLREILCAFSSWPPPSHRQLPAKIFVPSWSSQSDFVINQPVQTSPINNASVDQHLHHLDSQLRYHRNLHLSSTKHRHRVTLFDCQRSKKWAWKEQKRQISSYSRTWTNKKVKFSRQENRIPSASPQRKPLLSDVLSKLSSCRSRKKWNQRRYIGNFEQVGGSSIKWLLFLESVRCPWS